MHDGYIRVEGRHFCLNHKKINLYGYGLGTWMNLEHFMLGIPGTDFQIRTAVIQAYGKNNADRFWSSFYRAVINEDDFRFLKGLGINTLRLPFSYRRFEDDQAPYTYNEQGFQEMDRVLSLCEKYEIYAVLDLHAVPGGQNPDWHSDNAIGESLFWEYADFRHRTVALWKTLAKRYRDNPWIAAYDLLNEPVLLIPDKDILNTFIKNLIREIRTVDKNHMLFVEGDMYGTQFDLFDRFDDPNVACSFHYYPFLRQHLSDRKTQKERILHSLHKSVTLNDISERLERPAWCGETGALLSRGNREQQESMLWDMLNLCRTQDISWSLWSYKDARNMGLLHPGESSGWMNFSREVSDDWNFWDDFESRDKIVDSLIRKSRTEISKMEKLKLGFRVLANQQLILKERLTRTLRELPFETFLEYADSFRFSCCDQWENAARMVREFTGCKSDK